MSYPSGMASGGSTHHVEDIGRILLDVQDELRNLREGLNLSSAELKQQDTKQLYSSLKNVISRAENDLRSKADVVFKAVANDTSVTLPSLATNSPWQRPKSDGMRRRDREKGKPRRATSTTPVGGRKLASDAIKESMHRRMEANPRMANAREFLQERYGVPAPKVPEVKQRPLAGPKYGRRMKEKVTRPNTILPKENRHNPGAAPPTLTQKDFNKGVCDLMNRGFIPPNVDVTPALCHNIIQNPAPMHEWTEQFVKGAVYTSPFSGFSVSSVKLDMTRKPDEKPQQSKAAAEEEQKRKQQVVAVPTKTIELPGSTEEAEQLEPVLRSYNELMDTFSLHQFIIRRGKALDSTPEFVSFRRKYSVLWGSVSQVVEALEDLMTLYSVPIAYIDGQRVANLAVDDLERPTEQDLLGCVVNIDRVMAVLNHPGQKFKGPNGKDRAATCIQAGWKGYATRQSIKTVSGTVEYVVVIQAHFRGHLTRKKVLPRMEARKAQREEEWKAMMESFSGNWHHIQQSRRVLIHVPSLSFDSSIRRSIVNFNIRQNTQLGGRLCSIADRNADVLYLSPYPINDDLKQYYMRLLKLGGIAEPDARYKIICPENYNRFPPHFSLSSLLLYSPNALKRIKNLIRGREAYIVPGQVGPEEVKLAMELGVPVLGTHYSVSSLFSTKSGSKRIFAAADVNIPPGAHDIYEENELYEHMSKLIIDHLEVKRWILKVDDEFGGRGHAFFDVPNLKCYEPLLSKKKHLVEDPVALVAAYDIVVEELVKVLPRRVQYALPHLYPSWKDYLKAFVRVGGVIEACPTNVIGSPSANIVIEPDGTVEIQSTHEQIFASPYCFSGAAFPQACVPYQALRDAAQAVGNICFMKNIIGYVGIDFVASQDNGNLRLWAVDLNLRMTDTAASYDIFHFLMRGKLDSDTGIYHMVEEGQEISDRTRRDYVSCGFLSHPSISQLQYNSFFNMCRLKGVSFDLQENIGTVFHLMDSFLGGAVGITCVGKNVFQALSLLGDAFDFMKAQTGMTKEATVATIDESNFKIVAFTIKTLVDKIRKKMKRAKGGG